jgi:CheY-like chemotaxis protein
MNSTYAEQDVPGAGPLPRILLVDDDPEARLLYARHLRQRYQWEVVEADTGAEALRILDPSFHAVVLDEMMPEMSGMQVLQTIRSRPDLQGTCVIMLTATNDPITITRAIKYSPNDYLLKMETTPEALHDALVSGIGRTNRLLRPVRVFLCHSSHDKEAVGELYRRLKESYVDPWLDEEDLIGGQDWEEEIRKAVKRSDIVVICISSEAFTTPGFLHKEIAFALNRAEEQPEGSIFIIPLRLQKCPIPSRLAKYQWIDYTKENGWERLMASIYTRARQLGCKAPEFDSESR